MVAAGRRSTSFRATSGLLLLADWLRSYAVTVVGMEFIGVYWRAVFYLLKEEFECRLYNARHLRHVPGLQKRRARRRVGLPAGRARPGSPELRVDPVAAGTA